MYFADNPDDQFVFEFESRKWKRRGLGRNFPFDPLFVLAKFWADKKQKKQIRYCASTILLFFVPDLKVVRPRHPPRTFSLGLLAPRCLGFLLILAIPALRSDGEGRRLFGGRIPSFPQLRLVSAGLDQSTQPTPFLVFISAVCGVASATKLLYCKITAVLIL